MRVHYIQHGVFDEPGAIKDWAEKNGYVLTHTKTYEHEAFPSVTAFDFLIILGGMQSLLGGKFPEHVYDEIRFIKEAIDNGRLILGICLGAQLIAESLGAKTERSPFPEIGIFPIALTIAGENDPVLKYLPSKCDVMHMHYDMAGLVQGARILASSEGCPRQAFAVGDKIYAMQFHLEMTNENIKLRLSHITGEIEVGPYIATLEQFKHFDLAPVNQKIHD